MPDFLSVSPFCLKINMATAPDNSASASQHINVLHIWARRWSLEARLPYLFQASPFCLKINMATAPDNSASASQHINVLHIWARRWSLEARLPYLFQASKKGGTVEQIVVILLLLLNTNYINIKKGCHKNLTSLNIILQFILRNNLISDVLLPLMLYLESFILISYLQLFFLLQLRELT